MNEREELLEKFQKAMPLVNELTSLDNKADKYDKTKDTLRKVIAVFTFIVAFSGVVSVAMDWGIGGFIGAVWMFILGLGLIIWLYTVNNKKIAQNNEEREKIKNSEEFSFVPLSYRNPVNMVGIYMVLVDMRADTFKEAINVWEQDKHNMVMEAKPSVIVK
ncbi:MAG: hypothetical protein K2J08_12695 [Ruminococcus sp.]|nr:hypothetical protein [Ruminococcus sp.]